MPDKAFEHIVRFYLEKPSSARFTFKFFRNIPSM